MRLDEFLGNKRQKELLLTCIQGIADELARQEQQTMEEAVAEIFGRADALYHLSRISGTSRNSRACSEQVIDGLLRRHGLTGAPPVTLDEMGRTIGRTRERA